MQSHIAPPFTYYSIEIHHDTKLTEQITNAQLKKPIPLLEILNILQSSQRAITHIYTVEILKNTQNPSITEPSFGSCNREYIMDGEKKNHTCGKMLKWRVDRASFFQEPEKVELHNQQSEKCNNGTMLG